MKSKRKLAQDLSIDPGQQKRSRILVSLWGRPEKCNGEAAARAGIGNRVGVISFFQIHEGVNQGHIDLVEPRANGFSECASQCYFSSREIWFWPLQ
jgi:hypothetical protein